MIWLIRQFPELDHLDPHQRATLLKRVPWTVYASMIIRAGIAAGIMAVATTCAGFSALGGIQGGFATGISVDATVEFIVGITALLVFGGIGIGLYLSQLRSVRKEMRLEIAAGFRGERPPFCFSCGYDLRGSKEVRCPECGHAIAGVAPPTLAGVPHE